MLALGKFCWYIEFSPLDTERSFALNLLSDSANWIVFQPNVVIDAKLGMYLS